MASASSAPTHDGFLVVDKPAGWTSHDVVAKLRSITGVRAIGHAGTLDPFATGVLVCAFGRALKVVEFVHDADKTYLGRIRLGQTSDTDDVDGSKTTVELSTPPDEATVLRELAKLTGTIEQLPPAYSALKVQGRRMYELARAGKNVERKTRRVTVYELKLLSFAYPTLEVEVRVSSGTYIRAIARDLGAALKTGGFLEQLHRTRVGSFSIESAVKLTDVEGSSLGELLVPLERAVERLPTLELSPDELRRLAHGQVVPATTAPMTDPAADKPDADIAVLHEGRLVMLVRFDPGAGTLKAHKLIDTALAAG